MLSLKPNVQNKLNFDSTCIFYISPNRSTCKYKSLLNFNSQEILNNVCKKKQTYAKINYVLSKSIDSQ